MQFSARKAALTAPLVVTSPRPARDRRSGPRDRQARQGRRSRCPTQADVLDGRIGTLGTEAGAIAAGQVHGGRRQFAHRDIEEDRVAPADLRVLAAPWPTVPSENLDNPLAIARSNSASRGRIIGCLTLAAHGDGNPHVVVHNGWQTEDKTCILQGIRGANHLVGRFAQPPNLYKNPTVYIYLLPSSDK
jgi:hypothetical protein